MLYEAQRNILISVLEDLKINGLIDCAGGALSLRCNEEHILINTTGSAFKRWHLDKQDFIVLDTAGNIVEMDKKLGPAGTPIHLAIYGLFSECQAIIHAHSKYSLAFASLNMPVPSTINLLDTLGEVPCIYADDIAVKNQYRHKKGEKVDIPEGMVQRQDVAAISIHHLIPNLKENMLHRKDELLRHGLAFTVYKHGIFVFARSIDEAFENLVRVETSACTSILSSSILATSKVPFDTLKKHDK